MWLTCGINVVTRTQRTEHRFRADASELLTVYDSLVLIAACRDNFLHLEQQNQRYVVALRLTAYVQQAIKYQDVATPTGLEVAQSQRPRRSKSAGSS